MRLHHLAFRTRRLAALEQFYAGILGLEVLRRDPGRSVWLAAGETVLMLELSSDQEPSIAPQSLELVAFGVSEQEKRAFERLFAARRIAIEARTEFTLYVRDPDGRRVGVSSFEFG